MISNFQTVPYCEHLCPLKLPSLRYRCKCGDVIIAFKFILTNIVPDLFLFATISSTRCHSKKLSKTSCRLHMRNQFFPNRVTSLWNRQLEYAVSATCLETFRSRVDVEWSDAEWKYDLVAHESLTHL